jgi:molybdate transport system substrate-binding protein
MALISCRMQATGGIHERTPIGQEIPGVGQMGKRVRGALLGLVLAVALGSRAQAAEIQIIAGGGIARALDMITAQFERDTGHKVVVRYGTTPQLIEMVTSGSAFDLGVVPDDVLKNAAALAKFAPGPAAKIARVGIGVAVRTGAQKPDISTPEALKQTLLAAKSIASIPASSTGNQLAGIYESLGVSDAMKAKTKVQQTPGQIVDAVASGEAELAVFLLNVLADARLDIVGPFPAAVQREVAYAGGLSGDAKQADLAKAFVAYLSTSPATSVLKARGLTPG